MEAKINNTKAQPETDAMSLFLGTPENLAWIKANKAEIKAAEEDAERRSKTGAVACTLRSMAEQEIKNLQDAITRARWELQGALEQACWMRDAAKQAGNDKKVAALDALLDALNAMQDNGKAAAKATIALRTAKNGAY